MNLSDTAEISRSSLIKQHIMDWKSWRLKNSIEDCSEERLLAGCFLAWTKGDIQRAIVGVQVHCSGQFIDRPRFFKCQETLEYLQDLKTLVDSQAK